VVLNEVVKYFHKNSYLIHRTKYNPPIIYHELHQK